MRQNSNFKDWILLEDDNYMIIGKPPYVATLEDRASNISVLALAREYSPGCQVCHRLDKETSGALIIAKNSDAYKHVNQQFSDRKVTKTYHAIAGGRHSFEKHLVDLAIHVSASGNVRISKSGKPSATIVDTIEEFRSHTLVECKPITGRMHQIRVHMAALNASLVADLTYGGKDLFLSDLKRGYRPKKESEERPIMARVALHAYAIEFNNINGETTSIECPYPKDFQTILNQLRKFI